MQSTGQSTGEPNDAFLIEVTDRMPGEPYGFVSVSVVEPSRSSDLPPNLTEGQVQEMKEVAGSYGAEVLVIERQETPRRQAFYGLGMRRTDPPSAGVTGLPWCSHEAFPAALAAARPLFRRSGVRVTPYFVDPTFA